MNKIFLLFVFSICLVFSQNNFSISQKLLNNLSDQDFIFEKENTSSSHLFKASFNSFFILNNGHTNLDNNAELFIKGKSASFFSARLEYYNSWLSFTLEPYTIKQNNIFTTYSDLRMYSLTNNQNNIGYLNKKDTGIRQSNILIHYKGFGIKYGIMSHWWGPGFHSALTLTSNAPSQESYSIGTYKDIQAGKLSYRFNILTMPYKNYMGDQIYFSGLKANLSYNSKSAITTFGFHRTYLSGNFDKSEIDNNLSRRWTILDATGLIFEPLFGQSKKGLEYTIPGTPGFDQWDQLLSAFIKIKFIDQNLEIYLDLASDDNRANFIDLRAHWDHTIGYQLGINKIFYYKKYELLTGAEFLTTRISNTLNPNFYRGNPNSDSFYTKKMYDYFSYKGRRIGAHSGSSSDDLIFLLGIKNNTSTIFMTYNKERHGIKSMIHPELKFEYSLSYQHNILNNHKFFITIEYEKIKNFAFIENNLSISRLLLFGYSLYL
ncbi:MAG: hypothetical protein CMG62_09975 [Candidatus Marinimicrobia bacterium]|nr:hypothetical protein [Candidatus Neomarinimicrobiota bacterium]|tara:strand:+ start:4681 stop:6147 length:1467 start_codon:yes stop_codon:yes gene_type:complete